MPEFRHSYAVEVRWRDLDPMNHVNNAVFFTYLEEARLRYLRDLHEAEPGAPHPPGWIAASVKLDYKRPVGLGDTVEVKIATSLIGRTSIVMSYVVFSRRRQEVVAVAESVGCTYDYGAERPVPLEPELVAALERFEGGPIPRKYA
jgi:acyl-CoA thioester hydrolase